ncbi:MAG: phage protease [Desulfobacteraceae bacterium]
MDKEIALSIETSGIPEWIRILPLGLISLGDGRPGFEVDQEAIDNLVSQFAARGLDMVVDYEHQTLEGGQAPAAGWIKCLESREDGLWARVEWTEKGRDYLNNREYRYFSPVLTLDPETRRPIALHHVALTNTPAINHLPPLVAKLAAAADANESAEIKAEAEEAQGRTATLGIETKGSEDQDAALTFGPLGSWSIHGHSPDVFKENERGMTKQIAEMQPHDPLRLYTTGGSRATDQMSREEILSALGLPHDAHRSQIQGTITALKSGSAHAESLQKVVAKLQAAQEERASQDLMEQALKSGKVTPAQREWAIEYARQDPEGFKVFLAQAPKVIPVGEKLELKEECKPKPTLSSSQLEINQLMGISEEIYLKYNSEGRE